MLSLPFLASLLAVIVALAGLLRRRPSPAMWFCFAGLVVLALDSAFTGLALRATSPGRVDAWLTAALLAKACLAPAWIGFSLAWSRGNYREFLSRWWIPIALFGFATIGLAVGFRGSLLHVHAPESPGEAWQVHASAVATAVNVLLLCALVLVLVNLEQTFRAAVGTSRWRIKFVFLGLGVIFGAQLYVRSQVVLFSTHDVGLLTVEPAALLVGCLLLVVAYLRTGLQEIDVYPSTIVLRSSVTMLIVGVYLAVVGVLAEVVRYLGGVASFQFQALVVLLGMAGLGILLLSDRLRQRVRRFVARHFQKAQHDSVKVWGSLSRRVASVRDEAALCDLAARLVAETFEVLAVSVWVADEADGRPALRASTRAGREDLRGGAGDLSNVTRARADREGPFNLEGAPGGWAETLKLLHPTQFPNGGDRWCVPLRSGDKVVGFMVLADRVNAEDYTVEDVELLKCIGDQVTSVLLNLRLANEVGRARELEAFRTMSAFFVHDLKNTASSLNLMLKNLPVHFDDPEFRQDALRGIGNTARRIEELIARLTALRQQPDLKLVETDLGQLVADAIDKVGDWPGIVLSRDLGGGPPILADRDQLRSVVTNLVLNARDAMAPGGTIEVRTLAEDGRVVLSVRDEGCGMTPEFVRDVLFRPFHSTKKKGLGIGMFQSRMIVEKHGGRIDVQSEPGKGTTFRVVLPVRGEL